MHCSPSPLTILLAEQVPTTFSHPLLPCLSQELSERWIEKASGARAWRRLLIPLRDPLNGQTQGPWAVEIQTVALATGVRWAR